MLTWALAVGRNASDRTNAAALNNTLTPRMEDLFRSLLRVL
jgi:hypothetical protein